MKYTSSLLGISGFWWCDSRYQDWSKPKLSLYGLISTNSIYYSWGTLLPAFRALNTSQLYSPNEKILQENFLLAQFRRHTYTNCTGLPQVLPISYTCKGTCWNVQPLFVQHTRGSMSLCLMQTGLCFRIRTRFMWFLCSLWTSGRNSLGKVLSLAYYYYPHGINKVSIYLLCILTIREY